jgi:hypothetical protein
MNYFRLQTKGYTLNQMKEFNSADGGDGYTEGLCVSESPDRFGGAEGAYDPGTAEIVVLKGKKLASIYDGARIRPTEIVARFPWEVWKQMIADETAWDYEDWS